MMRVLEILLCIVSIVAPATLFAAGSAGTNTITSVVVDSYDGIIGISGPVAWGNPDNCGGTSTANVLLMQATNAMYKDLLAAVLMASASGKTVNFWVTGCSYSPWSTGNSAPVVTVLTTN